MTEVLHIDYETKNMRNSQRVLLDIPSQIIIVIGKFSVSRILDFFLVDGNHLRIHLNFWWSKCGHGDEFEIGISNEFTSQIEERFLEVVVGLGGNIVVLEILLAMEGDALGFDFAVFHVDFVSDQNNWDILTNTA